MPSVWRRKLTFPSKGEAQSEGRRSVAALSSDSSVTTLSDCLNPCHLLVKETCASPSRGPAPVPLVMGRPTMTSGVTSSDCSKKRKRLAARPSDGELAAQDHRPLGHDESRPGPSGSEQSGVLSSHTSTATLVCDSGDPGGSGDAGCVVVLPVLDPCGWCGTLVESASEFEDRLARAHGVGLIRWACRNCGRVRSNRHQIACHLPKCRGSVAVDSFRCERCPRAFKSARGLSLHKLRAHTAVYLAERSERGGRGPRVAVPSQRMPDEVNKGAHSCRNMPSVPGLVATDSGAGEKGGRKRSKCRPPRVAVRKSGRLSQKTVTESTRIKEYWATPATPPVPQQTVKGALFEILKAAVEGKSGESDEVPITEDDCCQGAIMSASSTLLREGIGERLQRWIAAIGGTPLGPIERVDLLVNYALPRVIFEANHCIVSDQVLTGVDAHIKQAVEFDRWANLNSQGRGIRLFEADKQARRRSFAKLISRRTLLYSLDVLKPCPSQREPRYPVDRDHRGSYECVRQKQLQGQPGPQPPPVQVESSDDDQQPPPQQWQQQEPDGSSSSGSLTSSSSSSEQENHQQEPQSEVHLIVSSDEEQPPQQQQPEQQTRGSAAAKRKLPFSMASPAEATTSENKAVREIKSKKRLSVQPPQKKRRRSSQFKASRSKIPPKYSRVSLQKIPIVFKELKKLYRDIGRTVLGHQGHRTGLPPENGVEIWDSADLPGARGVLVFTQWLRLRNRSVPLNNFLFTSLGRAEAKDLVRYVYQACTEMGLPGSPSLLDLRTAVSTYNFETNDYEMRKNLSSFMCHSAQTHQRFYALHETVQRAKQMRDMFVLLIHPRPPPLLRPPTLQLRAE
ncbi:hypothetical protein ABVT39_015381 [Epinephelus coioides]